MSDWTKRINYWRLLLYFAAWVAIFGGIYWLLSLSNLITLNGQNDLNYWDTLYLSLITSLTASDISYSISGPAKIAVSVQLLGGVLLAGLAVHVLVSIPAREIRKANKACRGWWVERYKLASGPYIYNFTVFTGDGAITNKDGENFDPGGRMDGTTYTGKTNVADFPRVISIYKNKEEQEGFDEGVIVVDFVADPGGAYTSYTGCCYDGKYGKRDVFSGRKILDPNTIWQLSKHTASSGLKRKAVRALYPEAVFRDE